MKKYLSIAIILSLFSVSIVTSTGELTLSDDTTPPVSTHSLDPPEPDGDNGWYVDDVEVKLNATDDISGVKEIKYKVGSGDWKTIQGSEVTFTLTVADDADDLPIEYYAIDNVGNEESINSFTIDMDQTSPEIYLDWEAYQDPPINGTWYIRFTANAIDGTSGMNRVEFYLNEEIQEIINGTGPTYEWTLPYELKVFSVKGLICLRRITEENVSFFALYVWTDETYNFNKWKDFVEAYAYDEAGNWDSDSTCGSSPPGPIPNFLKRFTFHNDYEGYIGRFLIKAEFDHYPLEM